MKELSGRTALITGSNRGIGRAIAKKLADDGARVVLCGRDEAMLAEAVAEIRAAGGEAAGIALDLRLPESATRAVQAALDAFGSLDIVVNNAGATKRGDFLTLTEEDWMDGYALKMFGAVRVTRAAWPHLKAGKGAVVNISGSGGRTPGAQFTIGGSVNAALLSLTKALAELGLQDGVQVNCINPGPVRTARFEKRLAQTAAEHGVDRETALRIFIRDEKITQVGEPEDVAGLVAFLLSKHGRYVHGSLIDADGGSTKTV
jgi:NAD(P)-dependent dehydrogenase (short-subunit alcohol dehydrogenase family)